MLWCTETPARNCVNTSLSTVSESVACNPAQVSLTDQPTTDLTIVSTLPKHSTELFLSGRLSFISTLSWHCCRLSCCCCFVIAIGSAVSMTVWLPVLSVLMDDWQGDVNEWHWWRRWVSLLPDLIANRWRVQERHWIVDCFVCCV